MITGEMNKTQGFPKRTLFKVRDEFNYSQKINFN